MLHGMQSPTHQDISRIYEGFNEAYQGESGRFGFPKIKQFSDMDNGVRLELNDEVAQGYWELFRPTPGMLVCLTEGIYYEKYQQRILPKQDIITIRFVLSGKLTITFDEIGTLNIPQASCSIMFTKEDKAFDLLIDDGSHLSSVTFHLDPQELYRNFEIDRDKFPAHLQKIIYGGELSNHLYNFPITACMMDNVMDLLNMPYEGARRRVFTEAKSTELICRLFQEIEEDFLETPVLSTAANSVKTKVFEAQQIFVENYKSPPTLAEVARRVGLNRTTLCEEFREIFGVTALEFCQEYRMTKARELLQDRNLSISQVAGEVGYDYPTNFTAAFKKHFGILPKTVRSL